MGFNMPGKVTDEPTQFDDMSGTGQANNSMPIKPGRSR